VLAGVLIVSLTGYAPHSFVAREYVRRLITAKIARDANASVAIDRLHYNLFTLHFDAGGVSMSPAGAAAGLSVRAARIVGDLSWRALLSGRFDVTQVSVSDLDVVTPAKRDGVAVTLNGIQFSLSRRSAEGVKAGRVHLGGAGIVRLVDSTITLTRFDAPVVLDQGTLRLDDVRLEAGGIRVALNGSVIDPFGGASRAAVKGTWHLKATDACAAWLAGVAPCDRVRNGVLGGEMSIDGSLSAPTVRVGVRSDDLTIGSVTVGVDGEATVAGDSVEIPRLRASTLGGYVALQGVMSAVRTQPVVHANLAWDAIDVRALLDAIGYALPIAATTDGRAVIAGDPRRPLAMKIDADARLQPGMRTGVPAAASVTARLADGKWTMRVDAGRIGATSVESVVAGRLAEDATSSLAGSIVTQVPDLRAMGGDLRTLGLWHEDERLAEWTGGGNATVRLGGTVARPEVAAQLDLTASRPDEPQVHVRANVAADRARTRITAFEALRGDDRLTASAHYQRTSGAIAGEFAAVVPNLKSLDPVLANAGAQLQGAVVIKGDLSGTLSRSIVRASLHATGVVLTKMRPLPAEPISIALGTLDGFVTANDKQLEAHVDAVDRRVSAHGSFGFEAGGPFDGAVSFRDTDIAEAIGSLASSNGVSGVVAGELTGHGYADRFRDAQIDLQVTRLEGDVRGVRAALTGPARVRLDALHIAEAQVDLKVGDVSARLTRTRVDEPMQVFLEGSIPAGFFAPRQRPTMVVDALVDQDRIEVRRASGRWGDTTAEATGVIPASFVRRWMLGESDEGGGTPATVHLEARSISIADVTRVFPSVAGYAAGAFDVTLSVDAARPSLDGLKVDGRVERARVDAAGSQFTQEGIATIAMRDGAVSMTGLRWIAPAGDLTLNAESTIGGGASRFEAAAKGQLNLGLLRLRTRDRLGGTVRLDLAARGDAASFAWNGSVDVQDGAWVAPARGIAVNDLDARIVCANGRCHVEQCAGRVNGGTLAVEGDVPTPRGTADDRLRATVRGAGLELPPGTRHDIDADIDVTGGTAPRVSGTITVWPGAITDSISALMAAVSANDAAPEVESPANAMSSALSSVALDVRVDTGSDLTFAATDLDIAASANLRVRGTLSRPQLLGEIAASERGHVFLAGRSWNIETATVSLVEGVRGADVRVAATATAMISRYTVEINVSGPPSQPAVVMRSDPPLGQSDLASLLLTGSPGKELSESGTHQVASLVSNELLTGVGRVMGFDAVRVENTQTDLSVTDLEPVSRLTVTKRVTPKVDVIYSQGLSDSDDLAWILVYRPGWQALDLRGTFRTNGAEAFELRQELEFGKAQRATRARIAARPTITVARVDVAGVDESDAAELRSRMSLAAGKTFTSGEWQHDRQAILGFYEDHDRLSARVRASHTVVENGGYALKYEITPGPITRLDVRGYRPKSSTLDSLREIWSRVLIEEFLAEQLTDAVRVDLAARGHLAAEVATSFEALPEGGTLAVVDVAPGPRTRHRAIQFAGNRTIPAADLRQLLHQRRVEPRCWVEPSVVEAPLLALYQMRGFRAARIGAVRTTNKDRAELVVSIDEGEQFRVGSVTFSGTVMLGEPAARAGFPLAPDTPYSSASLVAATAALRTTYARAGYRDAAVAPRVTARPDSSLVDVSIAVSEGQRSVLQAVRVEGRDETGERLVTSVLDIEPGGVADPGRFDAGQQRLYNTGIFRTVDVDIRPARVDTTASEQIADVPVDAVITLEERAKFRLRYGIQFGPTTIEDITTSNNDAQPGATLDLQRRNLWGQGITAGAGGVWSAEQHRIRGTVSAATFRGRFVNTTFTIENANQDRSPDGVVNLIDRSMGAVLEQRWKFGRVRRVEWAYGFDVKNRRVEFQSPDSTLPLHARFAGLNTTITYDTRDNQFNPHHGMFHSSRVEAGAGLWLSDIAFGRYQVQQFNYFPVGRATLASGVRFGSLDVDNEREPASLVLFFKTGGGTTVRGYETDSLTPGYLLGLPAGGKVLVVINQEVRVPLYKRIGVVGFFDAGNTFTGLDTLSLSGLKVGIGAGVRFDTPVAVLRLDVGFPVPALPAGPRGRLHFSIGQAF
jgi:outer membrane protein assembly complex protein YaeT